LLPLLALLGEGQSASASARSSFMAHQRIMISPPMARRPMTRIVAPWHVQRWAGLR
jgi:hypothetical protein